MARHGEGFEGREVAPVLQGEEGEGEDHEEDGFFVDVPAEEEGGVAAEGNGAEEVVVGGFEEELNQTELHKPLAKLVTGGEGAVHDLETESEDKRHEWSNLGQNSERGVAN